MAKKALFRQVLLKSGFVLALCLRPIMAYSQEDVFLQPHHSPSSNSGTRFERKTLGTYHTGDDSTENSTGRNNLERKRYIWLGPSIGSHSANLTENSDSFKKGLYASIEIDFSFWEGIDLMLSFDHWQANTSEVVTLSVRIPSQKVTHKSIRGGLEFEIVEFSYFKFSLGPAVALGWVSTAPGNLLSIDVFSRLHHNTWGERIRITGQLSYQNGSSITAHGGRQYSFVIYSLMTQINLSFLKN